MNRAVSASLRLIFVFGLFVLVFVLTLGTVLPQFGSPGELYQADADEVELNDVSTRTKMFDRNGNEIVRIYEADSNREWVDLEDISPQVAQAVVGIEDSNFYEHEGINLKAIARAAVENVGAGGVSQGGSTITQQLIKNRVLTSETTISRKVTEAAYAMRLEDQMTKDEILEQYLNTVYFGHGANGVRTAAEIYWGKEPDELDWPEAAMLAAVIRLPHLTDPIVHPETAREQRGIALNRLAELGYITEEEARIYDREPVPAQAQGVVELPKEDYFPDSVRQILYGEAEHLDIPFQRWLNANPNVFGTSAEEREAFVEGAGLRVYTTLDQEVQAQAEQAQLEIMPPNDQGFTMAFASVEPSTGAVIALVGGSGYENSEYNIATSIPGRQPGSSFKTFVMATAYDQGYLPIDQVSGIGPCSFADAGSEGGVYTVNNFANSAGSVNSIIGLTAQSSNCGFVRLGQIVGIDNVISMSRKLGLDNAQLGPYKSLPLGSAEVSPLEMATAYATLANDGVRNDAYFIERIETDEGEVIYEHSPAGKRAVKSEVACWVTSTLQNNFDNGTGQAARAQMGAQVQQAAGKTGTTEDFGDAWFVGYTPYLATAVWMGHPDGSTRKMTGLGGINVVGGSFPAKAWGRFNNYYHADKEAKDFPQCPGYPRSGRFVNDNGEFGSARGCGSSNPFPVDTDGDGSYDRCSANVGGLYVCGLSGSYDENGQALPLYCPSGNFTDDAGNDGQGDGNQGNDGQGGAVGQGDGTNQGNQAVPLDQPTATPPPISTQTLPDGRVAQCSATHPIGVDTDGDGYIDQCVQANQ